MSEMHDYEVVWNGNVHAADRGMLCLPVHPTKEAPPVRFDLVRRVSPEAASARVLILAALLDGPATVRDLHLRTGLSLERISTAISRLRRSDGIRWQPQYQTGGRPANRFWLEGYEAGRPEHRL